MKSNTRRCTECHDPMTLGYRNCQSCGAASWEWIDPTMTDAEMKRRVIAAVAPVADSEGGERDE